MAFQSDFTSEMMLLIMLAIDVDSIVLQCLTFMSCPSIREIGREELENSI